jgi:hypothetical protein
VRPLVASAGRSCRTHQEATGSLIFKEGLSTPRRTPFNFSRPFLIREVPPNASHRLSQEEISNLVRTLTTRDVAILVALSHYRYLDRHQVEQLFFPSRRVSQRRIKWLRDHGLIYRWSMIEPPGWTRLHSLLLLSPRGARLLAASIGLNPRPLVHLSQDARDHCFNVGHDLGANAFFVGLAVASRSLADEGLYHWVGEERCRRLLRQEVGPRYAPAPDGWGRYLVASREIIFFLEWDRGTESIDRLQRKSANYIRYFVRRREANYNHILFAFPSASKELAYHKSLAPQLPVEQLCCVFWTTTLAKLEALGPRGPIWWKVSRRAPQRDSGRTSPTPTGLWHGHARLSLHQLPSRTSHDYAIGSCIGKSGWWERRPTGGQT